jgi:HAD superfamily hydrolase (TIGR01509 family)
VTVSAVLFDLDGTLVDTTWFHTVAWWRALADHGHVMPMAEVHPLIGMGGAELLGAVLGQNVPPISDAHDAYYKEFLPLATVLPGARELLGALEQRSVPRVLVTSSKPDDAATLIGVLGVRFDEVVHSENAERAKPDPDLFQSALNRISIPAESALAVGDARWDVEAAGRAGVRSIGVLTGGTSETDLRDAGAIEVYQSCATIVDRWSTGPLADA